MTIKWSAFPSGGALLSTDTLVGLRTGVNTSFTGASVLLKAANLSDVANVVTSFNNISPLSTPGDMLIRDITNNIRLQAGASGSILSVVAGMPAWINDAAAQTVLGISITPGTGIGSAKGGTSSLAGGDHAFAFGNAAEAQGNFGFAFGDGAVSTNAGSVVWGDSNATPTPDSAANQFNASFANGFRFHVGSVSVSSAGQGLRVAEGSNAKQGIATLIAGEVTVSNTAVTANSRIFLCGQDTNVTGFLRITARTPGTSFEITSSEAEDTGVVAYQIFEPA